MRNYHIGVWCVLAGLLEFCEGRIAYASNTVGWEANSFIQALFYSFAVCRSPAALVQLEAQAVLPAWPRPP